MKLFICILVFFTIFTSAKSQAPDSLRIYFNKDGMKTTRVFAKYFIDYIKLGSGRNLYVGHGHYMDMSQRSEGYYLLRGETLHFTGLYTGYYNNGHMEHEGEWFWPGRLRGSESIKVGKWKFYYENGKLKEEWNYKLNSDSASTENILLNYWDTTGRQTVKNGKGYYYYSPTVPTVDSDQLVSFSGKIANGKYDSLWVAYYSNGKKYAIDQYKEGNFIKGTSYDLEGNSYSYDTLIIPAVFPGGKAAMDSFISQHQVYPEYERENRIEGTVTVAFRINEDGTISDIELIKAVNQDFDNETERVIKTFPRFAPAKTRGQPVISRMKINSGFRIKQ